jgi:hypothetical protein
VGDDAGCVWTGELGRGFKGERQCGKGVICAREYFELDCLFGIKFHATGQNWINGCDAIQSTQSSVDLWIASLVKSTRMLQVFLVRRSLPTVACTGSQYSDEAVAAHSFRFFGLNAPMTFSSARDLPTTPSRAPTWSTARASWVAPPPVGLASAVS